MFRNVTSAQEAIAHRLSENSSTHEKRQEKLIQDIQSDNIAQSYTTLRSQWIHQREQLIENLKSLEKHDASLNEIQHVKNLIDCLNQLVENGEITKNCQTIINDLDKYIHLVPEAYLLTRKPLGNKMIRLPRHISKTKTDITHSMKTTSSEILHTQQSNEKLTDQVLFAKNFIHIIRIVSYVITFIKR